MNSCCADSPRVRRTLVLAAVLVLGSVVAPSAVRAQASEGVWRDAMAAVDAMERSDYDAAASKITAIEAIDRDAAPARFARGVWLLHHGEYDAAAAELEMASQATGQAPMVEQHRAIAAGTAEVVRDFATYRTRDGLFEIRYDASRDAVLIPWAEETLEAAYYEIGYDVGSWPTPPIRVEIYPRARTLAVVSPLTVEAIEGSGTIALCKYNKLMLTSPRATLQGYDWRTTLAHEYVHYAVAHLVRANVPIWMHEALAKFMEHRWTGARPPPPDPMRDSLLSERVAADRLITFAQMHPSMAYLPTPEDAATAYAQVFTVMEYLVQRRGPGVVRDVLARVGGGDDVVTSITGAIGEPFDVFEANWQRYLRGRPRVEVPHRDGLDVQLMPESGDDADVDRFAGVESTAARDLLRLGELLRARGEAAAAVAQYRRAAAELGGEHPILQSALAQALLDAGQPREAIDAVAPVVAWYPTFYQGWLRRGAARVALGEHAAAIGDLVAAGSINPFDPEVHRLLAIAYDATGAAELAARHRGAAADVASR